MIAARRALLMIEMPQDRADGFGGFIRSYVAGPTVWAQIVPIKHDFERTADRPEIQVTHRIAIRHRTDIDLTKRFRLGTRIFAPRGYFDPDGRRVTLIVWCKEIRS